MGDPGTDTARAGESASLAGAASAIAMALLVYLLGGTTFALVLLVIAGAALAAVLHSRSLSVQEHQFRIWARMLVAIQVTALGVATMVGVTGQPVVEMAAMASWGLLALTAMNELSDRPVLALASRSALLASVALLSLCWLTEPVVIDVLVFQETGAQRALSGANPYTLGYPNPYTADQSEAYYGSGLATETELKFGFPYPPLALVPSVIGTVLGDVRLAHLAAAVGTGWLLMRGRPAWHRRIGGVLFLTTPVLPFVIQQGWTEPFIGLLLVLAVQLVPTSRLAGLVVLGLLAASKQYAPLLLAPLLLLLPRWTGGRRRPQALAVIVAVAAIVTAPMALWDIGSFAYSVLILQFHQPFRPDALSFLSWAANRWEVGVESLSTPLMALSMVLTVGWLATREGRSRTAAAAGCAVLMLAFLAFAKQSFPNYYFVALTAACLAVSECTDKTAVAHPDSARRHR